MHQLGHHRTGSVADNRKTLREREKRKNDGDRKALCDLKPMVKQALCPLYNRDIILRDSEKSNEEDELSLPHTLQKNSSVFQKKYIKSLETSLF